MLEEGPFELGLALDLIRQITAGLVAAHAQGIVHRDLKTENVMVTHDGRAKILDFGLAKNLWQGAAETSLSIEGSILGTGRSMSPEQALGDQVTPASDLFSLGTLIYEVTTGQPPFAGSSIFRILAQVCSDPHPPPIEVNPALPDELAALIDGLLEKDPAKRPASAEDVLETLDSIALSISTVSVRFATPDATDSDDEKPAGDATLWMPPERRPRPSSSESTSGLHIRTLLRIALKDTQQVFHLGSKAQVVATRHDRQVRDLLANSGGLEIDKFDDGFLLLFELPSEAVVFALRYREKLAELCEDENIELKAGAGIHLGEMHMTENRPGDVSRGAQLLEVAGPAKRIAAHTADLAAPGQILLTQMAYELARRAFSGDDEVEPHCVEHGRYRYQDVDDEQPLYEVGRTGEVATHPPRETEVATRLSEAGDAQSPWQDDRRQRWILPILAAVALLALVLWRVLPNRSGPPPGPTTPPVEIQRPTVAVVGFKNLSEDTEKGWLSTALAELLTAELAAGGDLRLITGEAVARMKLELAIPASETLTEDALRAIHGNLGTDHVLIGSYLVLDGGDKTMRLNLRLLPAGNGASGGEAIFVNATGSGSELFELVSLAANDLRQKLGMDGISNQEAAEIKATLGASSDANRLYSEGLQRLRSYDALGASELLQQAVEADPTYALAHAALSRAWSDLGYDAKARESARLALDRAEGLPGASSLAIEARFHEVMGEWDKAENTYLVLRRFHPDDVDFGLRYAEVLRQTGRGGESREILDSLRQLPAPTGSDPRIDLAEAAIRGSQSDYEGAIEAAERAILKGTEKQAWIVVAEAHLSRWRPLRSLGRRDEAEAALEEARRLFATAGDRGKVADVLSGIALLLEDDGRLAQAERLYRQALDIHREIGNQKGVAQGLNLIADLIVDRGQLEEAIDMVGQAIEAAREIGDREREAQYLDTTAWVLLRLGDLAAADERARESLALYEEIGQPEGVAWGHYYLGQVALARGDVAGAQSQTDRALAVGREIGSSSLSSYALYSLAEIRLTQGDLEAARKLAAESRSLPSQLTPDEHELLRCRLLFESGELEQAIAAIQAVARELRAEERRDDEAGALALLAAAQLAHGDPAAARETIDLSRTTSAASQNPRLRLAVELAGGRIAAAAGDPAGGRRRIEKALVEATRRGLGGFELEARLALGELALAAGNATAQQRLEALATEAGERGFKLVQSKAERLLG